ncbi:hypothetical protein E2562_002412 [Oryza meyeriana var. granulata]|uniref:Uncharacterized protein n=1 Tax=Oryza meyeriana var. granulata TaxID=110450 RepID=A0A6G1F2C5_9ORYZ|nr:hypothetical protein E2562_002412 [Oryza meyeriana var. granulata]
MLDSSLFPMVPNEADREAPLLRRMLPPYIMQEATAEYRRRVMLLSGLDTRPWLCDADEIAYRLQHSVADLRREVEAVVVHRAMGLVVVVLGSPEDAELLLHEPPKTWLLAFGQQASVIGVQNWLTRRLRQSPEAYDMSRDDEAQKIIHNLVGLCALANPATVRSSSFPDRSLLLSGIRRGITRSDLFTRLSTFGALDDVVQNHWRGIAVAVFRSWHGAARLGRQPAEAWNRLGFTGCRRVPGADETHAITADIIVDELVRHRRSL